MSYIVPRDRPQICDECPFSAYSMTHSGPMCMLEENIVIVDRYERYAFCQLIDIDNGALFDKERARRYLRTDLSTDGPAVREVTE